MPFKDLAEVIDVREPKELPIKGKLVRFPDTVSADAGTILVTMITAARKTAVAAQNESGEVDEDAVLLDLVNSGQISDDDAEYVEDELLGGTREQLAELGIWGRELNHITTTLMVWHVLGREPAEDYWNRGGEQGKAPNRETRRRKDSQSSRAAGSARTPRTARPSTARTGGASSSRRRAAG